MLSSLVIWGEEAFPEAGDQLAHSLLTRNRGRCHLRLGADRSEGYVAFVRALFWIYSTVIALGLAYFIVIGLTHH